MPKKPVKKKDKPNKEYVGLRLEQADLIVIDNLALAEDRSRTYIIERILRAFVKRNK